MKIAILAATAGELRMFAELPGMRQAAPGPFTTYTGALGDHSLLLCEAGMGKINAASAATHAAITFSPDLMVNAGCAGAYFGSGLRIGDIAVATSEICADEGVITADGFRGYDYIGIPALRLGGTVCFNEFPASAGFVERARDHAGRAGVPLAAGKFATVSSCSGTRALGDEVARRTGAICENMEGAAVAQVALRFGIPFLEVRGISNMVEDRDLSRWEIGRAVEAAAKFLLEFLGRHA